MQRHGEGLGTAASLVTDGEAHDKVRMAAILQLATSLSLQTTDQQVTEAKICDTVIAARPRVSEADYMTFWRTRR